MLAILVSLAVFAMQVMGSEFPICHDRQLTPIMYRNNGGKTLGSRFLLLEVAPSPPTSRVPFAPGLSCTIGRSARTLRPRRTGMNVALGPLAMCVESSGAMADMLWRVCGGRGSC